MGTAQQFLEDVAAARDDFRAALLAIPERSGERHGEGASQWGPRQIAEHVAENELWYASEICMASGFGGLDIEEFNFETAAAATMGFDDAAKRASNALQRLHDTHLRASHERFGTVADALVSYRDHLVEHAEQLQTFLSRLPSAG